MTQTFTIGKLAQAAGTHVETIRYYQRRGLLSKPVKPHGGQRHYPAAAVQQLQFIKRAQTLGFTLDDVSHLLALDGVNHCQQVRELAAIKLTLIQKKMADLYAMQQALEKLVQQCDTGDSQIGCPLLQSLKDNGKD